MIKEIRIKFGVPVDLPDGFERALSAFICMVCAKYERDNPERVMWPCGEGCAPIIKGGEIVGFEEEIYTIECTEREDYHGTNPSNPRQASI